MREILLLEAPAAPEREARDAEQAPRAGSGAFAFRGLGFRGLGFRGLGIKFRGVGLWA